MVDYYLGLGILMLLAMLGVYLVNKYGQSVILAYILVGILIGPNLAFTIEGFDYHGIITDEDMIHQLLELGLIFLFFFVGLEFSITRLRETKKAAAAIAITHVSMNLFVGFAIATIFNWDLFGSIFLAGVIAVSSAAVATKTLKDLNRLNGNEVKFLLTSIIVEDFILIIMVALASGSAMRGGDLDIWSVTRLIASVCFLYMIFLLLGFVIIPRLYHYLERIQSDELFVLFAMAVIFLAAALADMLQIPRPLGAFFMGMTFAETKFSSRLLKNLNAIRMGFTAVFFMSFGMMISFNADVISMVIPMLILTVPLIIFNQVVILGCVSFFIGFAPREAVTIGSCLAGRGEDSLLYASVGANLERTGGQGYVFDKTARDTLFSFAGIYCFIMATLAPVVVRNLASIVKGLRRLVPKKWSFGATLIHRSMKAAMFSVGGLFSKVERRLLTLFGAYAGMLFGVILVRDIPVFVLFVFGGVAVIYLLSEAIDAYISPNIDIDLFTDMHLLIKDERGIHTYIIDTLVKLVSAPFLVSTLWGVAQIIATATGVYPWWLAPVGALMIIVSIAIGSERIHDATMVRPDKVTTAQMMRRFEPGPRKGQVTSDPHIGRVRSMDRKGRKGPFRPMRYEELLPTEDKKKKKDTNRSLRNIGK